jgi:phage terminase large subunit-like protein
MTTPVIAMLPPEVANQVALIAMTRLRLDAVRTDVHAWRKQARSEQVWPDTGKYTWYICGGRGSGKTWPAAHTFAERVVATPGEYGIVAPTFGLARNVCVEGPSGLLKALGTDKIEVSRGRNNRSRYVLSWNRSLGEMVLRNGSTIFVDGADDGAKTIQGYNLSGCWADEIGLWRRWQVAWEESIRYAVRIGEAWIVVSGTPKRGHGLVHSLLHDDAVAKSHLKTLDNIDNLNPRQVQEWISKYGGTTLGRQELDGIELEDVPGAAWQRSWIDDNRVWVTTDDDGSATQLVPEGVQLARIVVAIDPATTSTEGADATGIVAAATGIVSPEWCASQFAIRGIHVVPDSHGAGRHEHWFILRDVTERLSPAMWGDRAVRLYRSLHADRIVGETNKGGEMIEHTVHTVDPNVPFKAVHAMRGKTVRAEPVAALYEQGKVHHVGADFEALEDEMVSYVAGDSKSPNRMDALVWTMTELADLDEPGFLGYARDKVEEIKAKRAAGVGGSIAQRAATADG